MKGWVGSSRLKFRLHTGTKSSPIVSISGSLRVSLIPLGLRTEQVLSGSNTNNRIVLTIVMRKSENFHKDKLPF